jgi:hypothetical protein
MIPPCSGETAAPPIELVHLPTTAAAARQDALHVECGDEQWKSDQSVLRSDDISQLGATVTSIFCHPISTPESPEGIQDEGPRNILDEAFGSCPSTFNFVNTTYPAIRGDNPGHALAKSLGGVQGFSTTTLHAPLYGYHEGEEVTEVCEDTVLANSTIAINGQPETTGLPPCTCGTVAVTLASGAPDQWALGSDRVEIGSPPRATTSGTVGSTALVYMQASVEQKVAAQLAIQAALSEPSMAGGPAEAMGILEATKLGVRPCQAQLAVLDGGLITTEGHFEDRWGSSCACNVYCVRLLKECKGSRAAFTSQHFIALDVSLHAMQKDDPACFNQ